MNIRSQIAFANFTPPHSASQGLPLAVGGLITWPLILIAMIMTLRILRVRRIRTRIRFVYSGGRSRQPGQVLKPILNGRIPGLVQIRPAHPRR
jgi:hypothetical protein